MLNNPEWSVTVVTRQGTDVTLSIWLFRKAQMVDTNNKEKAWMTALWQTCKDTVNDYLEK